MLVVLANRMRWIAPGVLFASAIYIYWMLNPPSIPMSLSRQLASPIVACTVVKNGHEMMREWLAYHITQGIDSFEIYDNGSDPPLSQAVGGLGAYARITVRNHTDKDTGFINHPKYNSKNGFAWLQALAFRDCLSRYAHTGAHVALIDIDEFLYPCSSAGDDQVLAWRPARNATIVDEGEQLSSEQHVRDDSLIHDTALDSTSEREGDSMLPLIHSVSDALTPRHQPRAAEGSQQFGVVGSSSSHGRKPHLPPRGKLYSTIKSSSLWQLNCGKFGPHEIPAALDGLITPERNIYRAPNFNWWFTGTWDWLAKILALLSVGCRVPSMCEEVTPSKYIYDTTYVEKRFAAIASVHGPDFPRSWSDRFPSRRVTYPSSDNLCCAHYFWPSSALAVEKAIANRNPEYLRRIADQSVVAWHLSIKDTGAVPYAAAAKSLLDACPSPL